MIFVNVIFELMHKPLAHSLKLLRPGIVSRTVKSKERKHTGIPEPHSAAPVLPHLILNIKTPAGRAKERAGSAVYARKLNFFPEGRVENVQKGT
jgi:hypothetical protein